MDTLNTYRISSLCAPAGSWAIAVSAMRDVSHIEGARLAKCSLTLSEIFGKSGKHKETTKAFAACKLKPGRTTYIYIYNWDDYI